MFQANFDRIHENFFRNLKLQYTDLTSGDLRFCALLRLNMPTKEISKLLNISTRGLMLQDTGCARNSICFRKKV